MENKKLNEQESLALITQVIQNSKKGLVVGSGNSFLFWGYLTLAVSIAIFLLLYITGNQSWFWLGIVIPVSFYEKEVNNTYNSVAVLDADGKNLGIYRKTHIPDDHYYQEKFYFTPGDTGFKVFDTRFGTIGVGICWDQWFPETARCMALQGAELLFYPTAIGSEPILECDSMEHWRRCMQGHAASNLIPVIAANRIGEETVEPCPENGMQKSALNFYGSSFITDNTGALCAELPGGEEGVLVSTFDLDALKADRLNWGLFRDRRPEMYAKIVGK